MRTVAVTGISGYVGSRLCEALERADEVERIVGIDVKPPAVECRKLVFCQRDLREALGDVLADNQVDTVVHLAFVIRHGRDLAGASRINTDGCRNLLEACLQCSVEGLLYLSSNTVYGPNPDNPDVITEDRPLNQRYGSPYSRDKARVDQMFQDFAESHPDVSVTIVRSCPVIGPGAAGTAGAVMFTPIMMRCLGHDPRWQFTHEDDLVEAIVTLLRQRQRGIFNVAGDGSLAYSELVRMAGKRSIVLPALLWSLLLKLSWWLHLQSDAPGGVEFFKYPIVLDTTRLKETAGFQPRYSSTEALRSYLDAGLSAASKG